MNNRRRRNTKAGPTNQPVDWFAIISASGVALIWVACLVWLNKVKGQFNTLDDAMPFLIIVAGVSFSFGWKILSEEIAKIFRNYRSAAYYVIGLMSPLVAIALWFLVDRALPYIGM